MAREYGKWRILGAEDEGGQAHVFKVEHTDSGEFGALKRIKNPARIARFKAEVSALEALTHPNILKILDHDLDHEKPYIVTEWCNGGNLADRIRNHGPMLLVRGLACFRLICEGVHHAHQHDIVHRDIKPENVFFRDDSDAPVVGDFGLCYFEDGERHTLIDEAVGAVYYMAPEAEAGRANLIKPTSDVYSLGKLLHFMLSGIRSVPRESFREVPRNLYGIYEDPEYERVNELLDRMIVEAPDQRFKNAGAVVERVQEIERLIGKYAVLSPRLHELCRFCGRGYYIGAALTRMELRNLGFGGQSVITAYSCTYCGHTEFFRPTASTHLHPWHQFSQERYDG